MHVPAGLLICFPRAVWKEVELSASTGWCRRSDVCRSHSRRRSVDDSVLLREGVARQSEDAGFDVSSGEVAPGGSYCLSQGVRSSSPGCFGANRHTHAPDPYRRGPSGGEGNPRYVPAHPGLVLPQYAELGHAPSSSSTMPREHPGYLLKDRINDCPSSPQPYAASPAADRRSTRRWCPCWSAVNGETTRSRS